MCAAVISLFLDSTFGLGVRSESQRPRESAGGLHDVTWIRGFWTINLNKNALQPEISAPEACLFDRVCFPSVPSYQLQGSEMHFEMK